jgi:hypothetical protein
LDLLELVPKSISAYTASFAKTTSTSSKDLVPVLPGECSIRDPFVGTSGERHFYIWEKSNLVLGCQCTESWLQVVEEVGVKVINGHTHWNGRKSRLGRVTKRGISVNSFFPASLRITLSVGFAELVK